MVKIVSCILLLFSCFTAIYLAGKSSCAGEVEATYLRQLKETSDKVKKLQAENDQLYADLQNKLLNPDIKYIEVTKYVPTKQKSDSDCNLTLGTIGMLNERLGYALGSDDNPEWPADRRTTFSTVTESAFIDWTATLSAKYERLRLKCNTLVTINKSLKTGLDSH